MDAVTNNQPQSSNPPSGSVKPWLSSIVSAPAKEFGKQYGPTIVSGHATAHLGDYIVYNYQPTVDEDQRKYNILSESLRFERMQARCSNIASALPQTCEWLFDGQNFQQWLTPTTSDHHFLWIRGKPGSGKSTIMKQMLEHSERAHPRDVIISYFFNARATGELENSSLGLYRSLTHQLLRKVPELHPLFVSKFESKVIADRVEDWTKIELQEFLISSTRARSTPKLRILIDALDEGQQEDVRQLFAFLQDLQRHAEKNGTNFHICVSSRYFPYINIGNALTIDLENQAQHYADIDLYVRTKLLCEEPNYLQTLHKTICTKSQGVFLWVVLVVPMLNNLFSTGSSIADTADLLQQIPADLNALFNDILTRSTDDIQECLALLYCVLAASDTMTPADAWMALYYSTNVGLAALPDVASIRRRLLHCSHGLLEVIDGSEPDFSVMPYRPGSKPMVQFIHETVRTFLLASKLLSPYSQGLRSRPWAEAHRTMQTACLRCIQMSPCVDFSDTYVLRASGDFEDHYPFLQYAVTNVLHHAEELQAYGISQHDFMLEYRDSGCLRKCITIASDSSLRHSHSPAMKCLACVTAWHMHRSLLQLVVRSNLSEPFMCDNHMHAIYRCLINARPEHALPLLRTARGLNVSEHTHKWFEENLPTSNMYDQIRTFVTNSGVSCRSQELCVNSVVSTLLQIACCHGSVDMVSLLLEHGAEVNACVHDQRGCDAYGSALHQAARRGHDKVVVVLLEHRADVHTVGGIHGTPLNVALMNNEWRIARLLYDRGARPIPYRCKHCASLVGDPLHQRCTLPVLRKRLHQCLQITNADDLGPLSCS